jgi:glycosyltransferase involved in cell wall biosynthesis
MDIKKEFEIMIRVLQVIGRMHMGGAETMIMNIYRHIDRSKVQFDFAVHSLDSGVYDDEIKRLGGRIYYFPRFNGLNFYEYRKAWKSFFQEHIEHSIVHGHIGSCAALYLHVANSYGKVTIAHSHCIVEKGKFNLRDFIWNIYSYPTRYTAKYFFGCSYGAGVDRFGSKVANSNKFEVVNNAIDSKLYVYNELHRVNIRKELGINENSFVVGHIGRMDPPKNHFFLVDVFAEIKRMHPNSKLVLVGMGSLKEQLAEKIEKVGLADSVIMTGIRQDIPQLLSIMDIFIFPSIFEGLGIAAVEAQANGLPTLCSDVLPRESKVTELAEYLPLSKDPNFWADKALEVRGKRITKDISSIIIQNHYDIADTANKIQQRYLHLYQR